jgi:hypothetical protein
MSNMAGVLYEAGTAYPSRASSRIHPALLVWCILLMLSVVFVITYYMSLSSDFHIKTMFGSSLPPVFWESSCLIYVVCVCLRIVVTNTYCVAICFYC